MIHQLRLEDFKNDFFILAGSEQNELVFNIINEEFDGIKISGLNIEYISVKENRTLMCPSVIGIGNEVMMLTAENEKLNGKQLTLETLELVTVDFYG